VTDGGIGLAFAACGALLAWHRPRNRVGWLFLAGGLAYSTSTAAVQLIFLGVASDWNDRTIGLLANLFGLAWPLAIGLCLPMALLLFPDGRPVSPRWRWLIWAIAAEAVPFELMYCGPGSENVSGRTVSNYLVLASYNRLEPLWVATNIVWASILGLVLASLVVRYRRGSEVERRQLLWLVLAVVVVLIYAGVVWGIAAAGPVLALLVIALIPAAVTIAILRYQLLDIRLVVSRTVAYTIVTGLLIGVYAGLVLLITQALPFSSAVAVAASTLACVALFTPLRRRTQRVVDRQFNRARYDADQAIAAFAARVRNAVDLDAVSADLTAAVQTALEPAHLAVWFSRQPP
jgi:MFS family permease